VLGIVSAPGELVVAEEEALLLDRRSTVRRAVQRRLAELERPPAPFYRALSGQAHPLPTAVVGLGETGGRDDTPLVRELLTHDDEAVRRAALNAARWIVPDTELTDLAAAALHDRSEPVVRAAARLLRRMVSRIPTQIIIDACASHARATQLAGLRLARRADGWTRLEADLTLAADDDPTVARDGRADIQSWVAEVAPTLYQQPGVSQRERLRVLIDEARLEVKLDQAIRFHAGLPTQR
jgi:HEAT repeat protein